LVRSAMINLPRLREEWTGKDSPSKEKQHSAGERFFMKRTTKGENGQNGKKRGVQGAISRSWGTTQRSGTVFMNRKRPPNRKKTVWEKKGRLKARK